MILSDLPLSSLQPTFEGPSSLASLRERAWKRWKENSSLPLHPSEKLASLLASCSHFLSSSKFDQELSSLPSPLLKIDDQAHFALINGRWSAEQSSLERLSSSLWISSLEQCERDFSSFLLSRMQTLLAADPEPLLLLNLALAREGLFIQVPSGKTLLPLLSLSAHSTARGTGKELGFSRIHLAVEKGAEVTLLFSSSFSPSEQNPFCHYLFDFSLASGSKVHLITLASGEESGCALHSVRASLQRGAQMQLFHLHLGKATAEWHDRFSLEGEGSQAQMHSLALLRQAEQHYLHCCSHHRAPHTTSRQWVRHFLQENSYAQFQGKIQVDAIAQQSDALQTSRHLLLSPGAFAQSCPELDIFADDVQASHGSTIGSFEEEELFFLRSRGLCLAQAQSLLIEGMSREIVEKVPCPDLHPLLFSLLSRSQ